MDVLHYPLVLRMPSHLYNRLIVEKQPGPARHIVAELLEKLSHQHDLAPDLRCPGILRLGTLSRER